MGVICLNDEELEKRLRFVQFGKYYPIDLSDSLSMTALDSFTHLSHMYTAVGMVPSPFDCYLANRGLKTLHLRMREHQRNAKAVAQLLSTSPHVTETIYPGQ